MSYIIKYSSRSDSYMFIHLKSGQRRCPKGALACILLLVGVWEMPQAWLHRTGAVCTSAPEHHQNIKGGSRRGGRRKGLDTTSELTSDPFQVALDARHTSLVWKYTFTLTGGGHTWLSVKNISWSIVAVFTAGDGSALRLQCRSVPALTSDAHRLAAGVFFLI